MTITPEQAAAIREEYNAKVRARPRIDRAYDRGDSDAYYGRWQARPHIWNDGLGSEVIPEADMTPEEIAAYWKGRHENPSDRKDYG